MWIMQNLNWIFKKIAEGKETPTSHNP
jgi:hypothetical protein